MAKVKLANLGAVGLIQDIADGDLPPEAFTDARNIRFNARGALAFAGHRKVFKPAKWNPTWLKAFPPVTDPLWVYANDQRVAVWDGTEHTEITRVGGLYSGGPQDRWQGEIFNGVGIFNNGGADVPQMWMGFSPLTKLQDLAAWPTGLRAKWIRPFSFFLIAGGILEDGNDRPYRIRWSHPAAPGSVPASWALNDPSKDSGELDLAETPDVVVDGLSMGQIFVVYKERTAWAMQYVGGQNIFNSWQIGFTRGLLWRDCVQNVPMGHFVVGQDDIYVHSGQKGSDQSIVENRLRSWIFRQINSGTFYNSYTLQHKSESEVWFCFPEAGAEYASLAAVWNWEKGSWGIRELQEAPFASMGVVEEESELDLWGALDRYAAGDLAAGSAICSGVASKENQALPSAMEAQIGAVAGSGQVGVTGWPVVEPDNYFYGQVTESGGPLKLSDIALTNSLGQDYRATVPAKIILTIAPGVTRTGNRTNVNQAALWLDQLPPSATVILNMAGATLTGAAGASQENGFPALVLSGGAYYGYLKVNEGTITGGAAGAGGVQGYSIVHPQGVTDLLNGTTVSGDQQEYGAPSASLSSTGVTGSVPNGLRTLGFVDVNTGGPPANDKNLRLLISRVAGDSFVNATWDRSDITYPLRVSFTSDGTNRRREAVFSIAIWDADNQQVVAGQVSVQATHGAPTYVLTLDPTGISEVIQLPSKDNASATWIGTVLAQIAGGVGPFLYDWQTSIGTITAGQTTAEISLEQFSGYLARGQDRVFQGTVTCTVTDTGNGNDQIVKTLPVYLFFDNSLPQASHTGTGAAAAQAATTAGTGVAILDESVGGGYLIAQGATTAATVTVTPVIPLTLTATPASVTESFQGPGTGSTTHVFQLTLHVDVQNGVGPFTYDWSGKTGWTITNDGTDTITAARALTAAVDATVTYSGTLTCTVTDQTTLHQKAVGIPVALTLTNPRVRQTIAGTGQMRAQSADADGVGAKSSPQTLVVQVLPSAVDDYTDGANRTYLQNFTASLTGGVGPFEYTWSSTSGDWPTGTTDQTEQHRVQMVAALGAYVTRTGNVQVSVRDLGRPGSSPVVDTASFIYVLNNGGEVP